MLFIRTLPPILFLLTSLLCYATDETASSKEKNIPAGVSNKAKGIDYTFQIDNKINKNHRIDSVWVILDKFDHSGAGVVKRVFYPDASNEIVIADLPAGKYYAEIYVLGLYKKHFSSVISPGKYRKNKAKLQLDYKDVYLPGYASIPDEDIKLFAYSR